MVSKFRSPTFTETPTHMPTNGVNLIRRLTESRARPQRGTHRKSTPIYGHLRPLLPATPGDKGAIFRQVRDSACQSQWTTWPSSMGFSSKSKNNKDRKWKHKKVTSITYRTGGRQSLNMRCVFLDDSSLERAGKYRNSQAAAHAERDDPSYASFWPVPVPRRQAACGDAPLPDTCGPMRNGTAVVPLKLPAGPALCTSPAPTG